MRLGRPKAEYSQALRLLKMMDVLQHREQVTIGQLMLEFDINRRTVQRDLGVLHELFALEEGERNEHNEKTFRLRMGARAETLRLTLSEMLALYMGKNMFAFTAGTELEAAMTSLYHKLEGRLGARTASVRDALPKKLYCTSGFPKRYAGADDTLNDVLTALIDERRLRMTYRIPGRKPYDDVVHPYTLVVHNHALYVVAFSERAGARRLFALERMERTSWRGHGGFTYPADYDPKDELGSAFGITGGKDAEQIRLSFAPEAAPYVLARQWHPSMKARSKKDGRLELMLKVVVGEELLHWITGYGGLVRVLSPRRLRERVRERLRRGLRAHA